MKELITILKEKSLRNSEILHAIMNINDHPDIKEALTKFVKMKKINGINTVCPKFQKMILDLDPMQTTEDLLGEKDDLAGATLFILHLKNAINQIIGEITQEFSERTSTWEEYLSGVERLGFRELFNIEKKSTSDNDRTTSYWNEEHSMLWIIDSFSFSNNQRKVNSSTLYFNAHVRNDNDWGYDLPMSRSITAYTNVVTAHIDMREAPTYYFFEILKFFKPITHWTEFDCFDKRFSDNLDLVDDEVLEKMTAYNVVDLGRRFEADKFPKKLDSIVQSILSEMTEEELLYSKTYSQCLQYVSSRRSFIPEKYNDMLKEQVEEQFIEHAVGLFAYTISKMRIKDDREFDDYYDKVVETLTAEDLTPLYKQFKKKDKKMRNFEISEACFEKLKDKVEPLLEAS